LKDVLVHAPISFCRRSVRYTVIAYRKLVVTGRPQMVPTIWTIISFSDKTHPVSAGRQLALMWYEASTSTSGTANHRTVPNTLRPSETCLRFHRSRRRGIADRLRWQAQSTRPLHSCHSRQGRSSADRPLSYVHTAVMSTPARTGASRPRPRPRPRLESQVTSIMTWWFSF